MERSNVSRLQSCYDFEVICDVPHRIGENFPDATYIEVPLNQVDAF